MAKCLRMYGSTINTQIHTIYFLENRNGNFFKFLEVIFGKKSDLSGKSRNFPFT